MVRMPLNNSGYVEQKGKYVSVSYNMQVQAIYTQLEMQRN